MLCVVILSIQYMYYTLIVLILVSHDLLKIVFIEELVFFFIKLCYGLDSYLQNAEIWAELLPVCPER